MSRTGGFTPEQEAEVLLKAVRADLVALLQRCPKPSQYVGYTCVELFEEWLPEVLETYDHYKFYRDLARPEPKPE